MAIWPQHIRIHSAHIFAPISLMVMMMWTAAERARERQKEKKNRKQFSVDCDVLVASFRFQQYSNIQFSDTKRLIKNFNLFRRAVVSLLHICVLLWSTHTFRQCISRFFFLLFAFDIMMTLFLLFLLSTKSSKSRLFLFSGAFSIKSLLILKSKNVHT